MSVPLVASTKSIMLSVVSATGLTNQKLIWQTADTMARAVQPIESPCRPLPLSEILHWDFVIAAVDASLASRFSQLPRSIIVGSRSQCVGRSCARWSMSDRRYEVALWYPYLSFVVGRLSEVES